MTAILLWPHCVNMAGYQRLGWPPNSYLNLSGFSLRAAALNNRIITPLQTKYVVARVAEIDTVRHEQNGRHFADDIWKYILWN